MSQETTLEGLIASLNKAGWLVTELYQRDVEDWHSALRRKGDFTSATGTGKTPLEALEEAASTRKPRKTDADWSALKGKKASTVPTKIVRKVLRG